MINADCLDCLPIKADAVISDPPYGMNLDTDNSRFSGGTAGNMAKHGNGIGTGEGKPILHDDEPFDPTPWLEYERVVLWGWLHYAQRLPKGSALVWLKRYDDGFGRFLSDADIAWMKGGHGTYCKRDVSLQGESSQKLHPTQKPVELAERAIRNSTMQGDYVLDMFLGGGTTLVACEATGRKALALEIEPAYCEVAIRRWESVYASKATLDGQTLDQVAKARRKGGSKRKTEDDRDVRIARTRLAEINKHPEQLVSGDELRRRLKSPPLRPNRTGNGLRPPRVAPTPKPTGNTP